MKTLVRKKLFSTAPVERVLLTVNVKMTSLGVFHAAMHSTFFCLSRSRKTLQIASSNKA